MGNGEWGIFLLVSTIFGGDVPVPDDAFFFPNFAAELTSDAPMLV